MARKLFPNNALRDSSPWNGKTDMRQRTVLITGCSGLLGTALGHRLKDDYHLIGADVVEPGDDSPMHEVRHMDCTSRRSVREVVEHVRDHHDGRLESVIHLAAYYDFSGEPSPLYDQVTVQGTKHLLEELQEVEVGQFVFTSTMLVHAPVEPGEKIREDSPLKAKWAYPESKLRTEEVIREHAGGIPYALLRLAGVYTEMGQQPTLVQQIKRIHALELESFLFPGDTEAGQSIVHLDDAVDALVRTVNRREELGERTTLLVGEPDPPSYDELQDAIGELIWDTEWPTLRVPEGVAEVGAWLKDRTPGSDAFIKPFMIELADDHYGLDVSRAEQLLGWRPRHRILHVLPAIIQNLLDDPEGWYEANGVEAPEGIPERVESQAAEAGA